MILAVVGIVLIFVGGCLLLGSFAAGRGWKSTTATVLSSEIYEYQYDRIIDSGHPRTYTDTAAKFVYEYRVDGNSYASSGIDHGLLSWFSELGERIAVTKYPAGTRITVYYDPADPARAVLWSGVPCEAPFEIALGGLLLVAAWLWSGRRLRTSRMQQQRSLEVCPVSESVPRDRDEVVADWLESRGL